MIPPQPGPTRSRAEVRLFQRFRSELGGEWTVLHSVGMAAHTSKRWAEADFVLVGPRGVYCVEVKGGRVTREAGVWRLIDASGNVNEKSEGPFEQAGGEEAALRRHLQSRQVERIGSGRIAIGWGVAFPDIRFTVTGPDIDLDVVYDASDEAGKMSAYVERLADHWYARLQRLWGRPPVDLHPAHVARVVSVLRPDFDLRPSLRYVAAAAGRELVRLTEEQCRILDGLQDAERVIIRGSAGTGKTMLAIEECRRLAALGHRVLFVCFNVRLASWLRSTSPFIDGVDVHHFHGLARQLIQRAGRLHTLPDADESYLNQVALPELAFDVIVGGADQEKYDALVIDEAQDLLRQEYLMVLSALLQNGLERGLWRAFIDPKQNAFGGAVPSMGRLLEGTGAMPFRLTRNCRNTEPIALTTTLLAGVDLEETLGAEGPAVEEMEYRDRADGRRKLQTALNRLLGEGFAPRAITVLSRYRIHNSCLNETLPRLRVPVRDGAPEVDDRAIGFSTVAAFKGLENDVIVLVDVDDLASPEGLRSVYVGTSRARTVLVVLRAASTNEDRLELAHALGRRLAKT
jgi:hypothetical protein